MPHYHDIQGKQPRISSGSRATYLEKTTDLTIEYVRILGEMEVWFKALQKHCAMFGDNTYTIFIIY